MNYNKLTETRIESRLFSIVYIHTYIRNKLTDFLLFIITIYVYITNTQSSISIIILYM